MNPCMSLPSTTQSQFTSPGGKYGPGPASISQVIPSSGVTTNIDPSLGPS